MNLVIAFHGKAGSGKSTQTTRLTSYLKKSGYDVRSMRFAGPVYELHDMFQDYMAQFGYEKQVKHRALLQKIGTEVGRDIYGSDVWSNITATAANKYLTAGIMRAVIIDDMRFPEEFDAVGALKDRFRVIRISLQAPQDVRKKRADKWPEDPNHRSEISLDSYVEQGLFDAVIDTTGNEDQSAKEILEYLELSGTNRVKLAEKELEHNIKVFNSIYRHWESEWGCGANFKWTYNTAGKKELTLVDVSPVQLPEKEHINSIVEKVPSIMEQAESLVMKVKNGPEIA